MSHDLSGMALTQLHAAFAVFTKGLAGIWAYHLRGSPCAPRLLTELDRKLNEGLLPVLLRDGV